MRRVIGRRRVHSLPRAQEGRWFIWLLFVLAGVVAADSLHLMGNDDVRRPPVDVLGEVIVRDTVVPDPAGAPAAPLPVLTTTTTAARTTTSTRPRTTVAPVTVAKPSATSPTTEATSAATTTTVEETTTTSTWPPYEPPPETVPPPPL